MQKDKTTTYDHVAKIIIENIHVILIMHIIE